ncbi:DUF2306 domain-containing protein [Pseudonocardia humida]|uniref:DUF2306 domain-containing protein n=1 Tax=Pseudonocardia humida TaxID=2800819 RepID=A0ABT1A7P4_9PSEU|nr:DUF2306 domain-containing protein [Pseudonocardia humida]MCO1658938.1 DUF2306 domain-containing protein [Pseudonocardia humida]
MTAPTRPSWLLPTGLILLSAIPVLGGAVRMGALTGGVAATAADSRFTDSPVPIVVHVVGATVYCLLGAFQFVPRFRRRRPGWHRAAGRYVLVPCGLAAALSGIWMTVAYPVPPGDEGLLFALRLVFGAAMAAALVLGVLAARRRDVAAHRAWMTRGYAIGVGAGTQALVHLPFALVGPTPIGTDRALLLGLGWLINVAVAEWVIRRRAGTLRPAAVAA